MALVWTFANNNFRNMGIEIRCSGRFQTHPKLVSCFKPKFSCRMIDIFNEISIELAQNRGSRPDLLGVLPN
jgi:hypothetical protein